MLLAAILMASACMAQVAENRYLVYFTNKTNTPYSVNNPSAFLSQRAIDRRGAQYIAVDVRDLPVDPSLIAQVMNLGEVTMLGELKWMNAILIETTDAAVLEAIELLEGVDRLEVSTTLPGNEEIETQKMPVAFPKSNEDYGQALAQIQQLNGLGLHEDGYTGAGKWIAVLDGGFNKTDSASVLQNLINSDRLLATRNIVWGGSEVFGLSNHGTFVLSTMAADEAGLMIGTAPGASYVLVVTEDVSIERRIEEAFWIIGAEYADSMGVDIINTSLGYSEFDVETENYTYADMDGNTTLISRGSDIAASRGMLIVTSAGNQGHTAWKYISAPADGDSVLAIGAVWPDGEAAFFSSRGPSSDGRVKPNVMARGGATVITNTADTITMGNGTSFSAPVISGMAACLWQAHTQATAWQIHRAIEESSHLYFNPNDSMGFGIPNFEVARYLLEQLLRTKDAPSLAAAAFVFPNPYRAGEQLGIKLPKGFEGNGSLRISDISGRVVAAFNASFQNPFRSSALQQSVQRLSKGIYLIHLQSESGAAAVAKLAVR